MISEKMIIDTLVENHFSVTAIAEFSDRLSPGNMKFHYMPKVPLVLIHENLKIDQELEDIKKRFSNFDTSDKNFEFSIPEKFDQYFEVVLNSDPAIAARELYSKLRESAEGNLDFIYFVIKPIHQTVEFSPILDKLKKASSFTL
jgi:L-threonylcarbamoyladenylate synthase